MQDFVLFDDALEPSQPLTRLYQQPVARWQAWQAEQVEGAFPQIEDALNAGRQVALFVHYEAAQALAGLPVHASPAAPLVEALAFDAVTRMTAAETQRWLQAQSASLDGGQPCGVAYLQPGITQADYATVLARIAEHLRAGDSYQINFTWPLRGQAFGHPLALYAALRQAQPTRYSCLAKLGGRWVLSFSPELFFARDGVTLRARPMKGTAVRQANDEADAQAALALAADPKNRAENLMILDLLRNDLGRLAVPGSVRVPERFTVEPYPTVWQMTSSVQAALDERGRPRRWMEIFAALFPCGSVTGAPKCKSMEIIRALEGEPRGLYTGALGFIDARDAGQGPLAVFSVPIRTLQVEDHVQTTGEAAGTRTFHLGVGSGVVIDSDPAAEWQECWDKLRFVTAHDPGFGLIETFVAMWPAQAGRIERHLARLARSAAFFGFACDLPAMRDALAQAHRGLVAPSAAALADGCEAWQAACAALAPALWRTRLVLRKSGAVEIDVQPMPPAPQQPVRLLRAAEALDSADLFLRHKTTHRARYDAAWRAAEAQGAFDQIFCNERGELCEGGRSSLLLRLDGAWCTPALASGLLPGVGRQWLIDHGGVRECVLRPDALLRAEQIAVVNSLRGVLAATL